MQLLLLLLLFLVLLLSCCIGEYTHVLGVLVQGLLLSCVQLLSMRCCCMFWFGVAVAHVTVDAALHVLLHSAGVVAALCWCGCCIFVDVAAAFAIAVHSTYTIAVMCVQLLVAASAHAVAYGVTLMCAFVLQRTLLYLLLLLVVLLQQLHSLLLLHVLLLMHYS